MKGNGTPSDKTVKDLNCLLSDLSLHFELQIGRVNAVLGRLHRMTTLGPSIDDDDKDLGNDDDLTLKKVADEGVRMEEVDCPLYTEFVKFSAFLSTARVLLVAVPRGSQRGWRCDVCLDPCVRHKGRGVALTPGVSPRCWATCQLALQVVDICCL